MDWVCECDLHWLRRNHWSIRCRCWLLKISPSLEIFQRRGVTCTTYCQLNGNNPDFGIKQGTHNQLDDLFICCFSNGATNCNFKKGERVAHSMLNSMLTAWISIHSLCGYSTVLVSVNIASAKLALFCNDILSVWPGKWKRIDIFSLVENLGKHSGAFAFPPYPEASSDLCYYSFFYFLPLIVFDCLLVTSDLCGQFFPSLFIVLLMNGTKVPGNIVVVC